MSAFALPGGPTVALTPEELAYAEVTTTVAISGTSEGSPTDVVSLPSTVYEAVPTLIEFFCPNATCSSADGGVLFLLFDGSTMLCRLTDSRIDLTNIDPGAPIFGRARITPTAGAHTYNIKALKTAGTMTLNAGVGTGGAGVYAPISLRASRTTGIVASMADGWAAAGENWAYASADSPTFAFTVSGDQTGKYYPGMRLKLTQTTVKYFIVTKVAFSSGTTTVTVYGGTDYTLANAAITNPFYSMAKAPAGFPLDPSKWTVSLNDTSDRRMSSPSAGVWQNPGSLSMSIPIGVWSVYAKFPLATLAGKDASASLSSANNSESDANLTVTMYGSTGPDNTLTLSTTGVVVAASKTTYYVVQKSDVAGAGSYGVYGPAPGGLRVRAVCAYL